MALPPWLADELRRMPAEVRVRIEDPKRDYPTDTWPTLVIELDPQLRLELDERSAR